MLNGIKADDLFIKDKFWQSNLAPGFNRTGSLFSSCRMSWFPTWEMITEGREQSWLIEVQRGQRNIYLPLTKGSVTTNLGGRLLRCFPFWVMSWWFFLKFSSHSDVVRTFTFCAKAGRMWDLTRKLGYHKAEEEGTENWNKKSTGVFPTAENVSNALYIKYIHNKVRKYYLWVTNDKGRN